MIKRSTIPNLITLANLACGVLGIIQIIEGSIVNACYLVWAGALFDFLDGFAARLLKTSSDLGKQLDSLSDLVTFGVLPAMIYYHLLKEGSGEFQLQYLSIVVPIFSSLRLAKFNLDNSQSTMFSGLPTPANALMASSLPLITLEESSFYQVIEEPTVILVLMMVCSILMISPISLLSFKNLKFSLPLLMIVLLSIVLLVVAKYSAIPILIICYVLGSIIIIGNKKQPI